MADIAYKPIGTTNAKDADINLSNQIPPYEDEGIKYQGYSKKKVTGGYQLKTQTPFYYSYKTGTITGSNDYSIGEPPQGKILYINKLQLNTSVSAVSTSSYFRISEGSTSQNILFETSILRSESIEYTFSPPLRITQAAQEGVTPSGIRFIVAAGGITVNQCTFNVQGWYE